MDNDKRLKQLLKKKKLNDDEFRELVSLSPPRSFKKAPYLMTDIGIKDLKRSFKNLKQLEKRSKNAYANKCYLEVLSLRLLVLDLLLREYIYGKSVKQFKINAAITVGYFLEAAKAAGIPNEYLEDFKKYDKDMSAKGISIIFKPKKGIDINTQFGSLIKLARNNGMDEEIIKKLWKFNNDRIKGIHRLLFGEIEYYKLKGVCNKYKTLVKEVQDYVLKEPFWIPMN